MNKKNVFLSPHQTVFDLCLKRKRLMLKSSYKHLFTHGKNTLNILFFCVSSVCFFSSLKQEK